MGNKLSSANVVVSGIGFTTSIGNSEAVVLESLKKLKHGLKPTNFWNNPDIPVKLAGTIEGFDVSSPFYQKWTYPEGYNIPKTLLRSLPPHGVYSFCAIEQAIQKAGLTADDLSDHRTALYCSSAGSGFLMGNFFEELKRNKGMRGSPFGVVSTISGTLNFNFGAYYKIKGGNCGFVSACSSSAHAIGHAYDQIKLGRLDRVIVVGAEDINAESVLPFSVMRVLSNEEDPCKASCPFDKNRNGFVASGGAVALVIENSATAKQPDNAYGEVLDWAQSSDGYNQAISDPDGKGVADAFNRVLASSSVDPAQISYVNAHATSTIHGDRSEAKAIGKIFAETEKMPPVSSTKGLTGHPLSMAGAMEVAFCMLALKYGFIPGNAHLKDYDSEEMGNINLIQQTLEEQPELILKNSSGFGGSNVALLLQRWK